MIYPKKLLAVLPLRRQKARCFGLLPIAAAWAAEGLADVPLQTAWCRSGPRCKRCTARLRRSARAGSGSRLSVSAPSAGRCGGLWWHGPRHRGRHRPPSRRNPPAAGPAGLAAQRSSCRWPFWARYQQSSSALYTKSQETRRGRLASVSRGLGRRAMARPVK